MPKKPNIIKGFDYFHPEDLVGGGRIFFNPNQSCKSGQAFRVGFGPKVEKNFCLIRAWDVLFVFSLS